MVKQYILLFLIIFLMVVAGYYNYKINTMVNQQLTAINGAIQQLQKTNQKLKIQIDQAKTQSDNISKIIQQLKQQVTDLIDYQPIDSVQIVQYIDVKNYQYYGQIDYGQSYININEQKLSRFIGVTKHLEKQNIIKDNIISQQQQLISVKDYQIISYQQMLQNQRQINNYLRRQLQLSSQSTKLPWTFYGTIGTAIAVPLLILIAL